MFMHSGSPKRALNSITLTPSAVAKKPEFMTPREVPAELGQALDDPLDDRAGLARSGHGS